MKLMILVTTLMFSMAMPVDAKEKRNFKRVKGDLMKNLMLIAILFLTACSSTGVKKVVIDESRNRPDWVDEEKLSWEEDDRLYFKAKQTVRGDQRLNGCFIIASHDNKETLLRGIADNLSGQTQEAQTDISENAELILGKVRSGEWAGKLYGFKDEGQYFERYQIRDEGAKSMVERIDCYTLSSVGKNDYVRTKSEIMHRVMAVAPKVKEAISDKQADFFRAPASKKEPKVESVEQPTTQSEVEVPTLQEQGIEEPTAAAPITTLPADVKKIAEFTEAVESSDIVSAIEHVGKQ